MISFTDATTNGEAERLENRLRNLSSGLVGLRNCLHDQGEAMLPPTFVGSNNFPGNKIIYNSFFAIKMTKLLISNFLGRN